VSNHTISVVENLNRNSFFRALSEKDKTIAILAAYFHDIGKGPKSKWKDGIQKTYPDHPSDSVPMLKRILVEEFEEITEYQIKKICLLVIYHDLIGEIIGHGRSKRELLNLKIDLNELNMLIALSVADVSAINFIWAGELKSQLPEFIRSITEELNI